jgi:GTPase SAR1 family protein
MIITKVRDIIKLQRWSCSFDKLNLGGSTVAEEWMAIKLRRPILVGGVGLSFLLWLLQSLHHSVVQLGEIGVLSAIAVGGGLWLFQQRASQKAQLPPDTPLDRATVEKEITLAEGMVSHLEAEAENYEALAQLRQRVGQLKAELDRQEIRLAVTGGKAVGKTTLIRVLESKWVPQLQQQLCLSETPALFTGTDAGKKLETAALACVIASDLVLFVTNGDLTDSEFQTLQHLAAAKERTVLVFNKQDQYLPEERATVLHSLRQKMQQMLGAELTFGIAASPSPIKVRQHQPDGGVREWLEQPAPDIKQLTDQLTQILAQEGQQLVWATTRRAAIELKAEVKTVLNRVRRDRAVPVIEQYQWIAAAAAFANPVPALDLLATVAINAQVVMELGAIYQQKFSWQQAQAVAGTLGSLMLKLGLVELSTQTIGTVLKSNAITFVAGGAVQGVSAAYLTRLAGLSLIEYFQQQEASTDAETKLNLDKLRQTLQNVFQQNHQLGFLQAFVKQGVGRLSQSPQIELTANESIAI